MLALARIVVSFAASVLISAAWAAGSSGDGPCPGHLMHTPAVKALRQQATADDKEIPLAVLKTFTPEEIAILRKGETSRPTKIEEIPEEQRTFKATANLEILIAKQGSYQQRQILSPRWNPVLFSTSTNGFAQNCERAVLQKLNALPRVELLNHLSDSQKEILNKILADPKLEGAEDLAAAAEVVAVAKTLGLASTVHYAGVSAVEWERRIELHNQSVRGGPSLKQLFADADQLQKRFLEVVEKTAQTKWEAAPEREFKDVLSEALLSELPAFKTELTTQISAKHKDLVEEAKTVVNSVTDLHAYADWLAHHGNGRPKHWYADVNEVVAAAHGDEKLTGLFEFVANERLAIQAASLKQVQPEWIAAPNQDFHEILRTRIHAALAEKTPALKATIAERFPQLGNAPAVLLAAMNHEADAWVQTQKVDLAFGETIILPNPKAVIEIPSANMQLVNSLVQLGEVGGEADLILLKQILGTLDAAFLQELVNAKYKIIVAQNNVTNGARDLRARRSAANILVDHAEGVHVTDQESDRRIIVRTYMQDGVLVLDTLCLLHELGHALDLVLRATNGQPLNVQKEIADAFAKEHQFLPQYFHVQPEFFAEVFARYSLDRMRAERKFPMAVRAFDKLGLNKIVVGHDKLVKLFKSMLADAPVTARPNPVEIVTRSEELNKIRQSRGKSREPVILEVMGEAAASVALAKNLATHLVTLRSPTTGPFGTNDGFIYVSAATFNDPNALSQVLDNVSDGHGAVIFVDELQSISPTSPGFKLLDDFFVRMSDLAVLVLSGGAEQLKPLAQALPSLTRHQVKIEAQTPEQVAELVRRDILDDGFEMSQEALKLLVEQSVSGGYEGTIGRWRAIKQAQIRRTSSLGGAITLQPEAISYVLARDIDAGKSSERNPLDDIAAMIGLKEVKAQIESIVASAALAKQEIALGLNVADPPRLNLLFAGNGGTGKTTVATKLAESLFRIGYVKRKTVAQFKIQDIMSRNPEDSVKRMFEANRDGVIFIDEFHQLKDTDEGRRAFRSMIPYLTSPEYRNTVFIGAGYNEELLELIREVDPGAERRFVTVHFADYTKDEMLKICDSMLNGLGIKASDEVKAALLDQVVRKQRAMKNPGNAGDMETVIGLARRKQRVRLSEMVQNRPLTTDEMTTLKLEDIVSEPTISVAEVWKEIEALKGLEQVKKKLREIQALLDYNREKKVDILKGVEPYIILEGPPGSGKSTLAKLIAKLFAANDVVPEDKVVAAVGGDLTGGYVGNSTVLAVRKLFSAAWGKTLFIDEVGALAKAVGGYEEQAAKEILSQTENHRGKFIMVIADYPENVSKFLKLDAGLPRRFGTRLTLTAMEGRDAASLLHDLLEDLDALELDSFIVDRLAEISKLPEWASGGDVRTLAGKVRAAQAAKYLENKRNGLTLDPNKVLSEVMSAALDDLEAEVRRRPPSGHLNAAAAKPKVQFDRQTQAEVEDAHDHEHDPAPATPLTEQEKQLLDAISEVDKAFGARLNDAAELERQECDPQSEYNRALGEKLGIQPEEAMEQRQNIAKKMKIVVQVLEKEAIQHFKYHCPYCGGVESPTCAYINHPLEWKIQHSTRKPWTEEREVLREREIE